MILESEIFHESWNGRHGNNSKFRAAFLFFWLLGWDLLGMGGIIYHVNEPRRRMFAKDCNARHLMNLTHISYA